MSAVDTIPARSADARTEPEPRLLLLIFWLVFASTVAAAQFLDPGLFRKQDPDSLMRLVQVRDLLAGQGWFDFVQHRLAPPEGVSMHWSRLIDAPIAGLVLLGDLAGAGEPFALAAWPLVLLLGLMAAMLFAATSLAGRAATLPTLVLSLTSFAPLLSFLPGSLDHHNAQLVLLVATLAVTLKVRESPLCGLVAGLFSAISLAIGLEMLPYIALFGAFIALQWAMTGAGGRAAQLFGLVVGAGPAALYLLAGSSQSATACDALSWSYALPAAVAGSSLAAVVSFGRDASIGIRLLGLAASAALAGGVFLLVAPECLAGPYGSLAPELKALWLSTVSEAQPLLAFASREPVGAIATFGPPVVALAIAILRIRAWPARWALPAALIALAVGLSLYQVRTLPAANALAIAVSGAWLAEIATRHNITSLQPLRRALPMIAGFLLVMPLVHLALAWTAVQGLTLATGIAPVARADAPAEATAGLDDAAKECLDQSAADLLAQVPTGQVLVPVFYGSAVLGLSDHSAVAAPYHRGGAAILDAIRAIDGTPDAA
ncbi:MAG TPA: hypothetical protein VN240_04155, partial [Propylenella sp.]|nr:hypothetical protein [Propylenella sp.]